VFIRPLFLGDKMKPNKLQIKIKRKYTETLLLFRNIPSIIVSLFVVSVICMNLLANKTLVQTTWIALDGGILISWLSFMCMDIITKYFGPKASNKVVLLASLINLLTCLVFFVASIIPSNANDYTALNGLLGGTWFVLLGSTIAFLVSAFINNLLNWLIGKCFHKNSDGKFAFATQSYISTFIGQFIDNFIFSVIVFVFFASLQTTGLSPRLLIYPPSFRRIISEGVCKDAKHEMRIAAGFQTRGPLFLNRLQTFQQRDCRG
jgi:uncharacterized integral membrane protein (TIGR00697 family)